MVAGKVGTRNQSSPLSIPHAKEGQGKEYICKWDLKIDNRWNVNTANASTISYVPEPTNNNNNNRSAKQRSLAPREEQFREDKREKANYWKSHHGYGEDSNMLQVATLPQRRSLQIHTVIGIFPGQSLIQNKNFLRRRWGDLLPLPHPADLSKTKNKKQKNHLFGQLTDFNIVLKYSGLLSGSVG